jgi:hypothetical protein
MMNDTMQRLARRLIEILRLHDRPMLPREIKSIANLIQQDYTIEVVLRGMVRDGLVKHFGNGYFALPGCTKMPPDRVTELREKLERKVENKPGTQLNKAMLFIIDLLRREGPLLANQINVEAAAAGIKPSTLKLARRRMQDDGDLLRDSDGCYTLPEHDSVRVWCSGDTTVDPSVIFGSINKKLDVLHELIDSTTNTDERKQTLCDILQDYSRLTGRPSAT